MKIEFNNLNLEKTVSKEQGGQVVSHTLTLSQKGDLEARFTILLKGKLAKEVNGSLKKRYKITLEELG